MSFNLPVAPSYQKKTDGFCYTLQTTVKIQKPQFLVVMLNCRFVWCLAQAECQGKRSKAYSWLWSKEQRSRIRLADGVFSDWWNEIQLPGKKENIIIYSYLFSELYKILVVCRCLMSPCGYLINNTLVQLNTASIHILWATFLIPFPYAVVPGSVFLPLPSASHASVVRMPLMCQTVVGKVVKLQLLTSIFLFKGQCLCIGEGVWLYYPSQEAGPHPTFIWKLVKHFGWRFLVPLDYVLVSYCVSVCILLAHGLFSCSWWVGGLII